MPLFCRESAKKIDSLQSFPFRVAFSVWSARFFFCSRGEKLSFPQRFFYSVATCRLGRGRNEKRHRWWERKSLPSKLATFCDLIHQPAAPSCLLCWKAFVAKIKVGGSSPPPQLLRKDIISFKKWSKNWSVKDKKLGDEVTKESKVVRLFLTCKCWCWVFFVRLFRYFYR